jgi:molybdate transport system substrate-binding protein
MRGLVLLGVLLASTASGGCGGTQSQSTAEDANRGSQEVICFAAASTREPLVDLIAAFERQHAGVSVRPSFAASSTLAHQIEAGADAQLFISADEEWGRFLSDKGLVGRTHRLLGNRLVLVVPVDAKTVPLSPPELVSDDFERLALADPRSVPAGRYGKQALTTLGLWDRLESKVAGAADVRQALSFVETGAAEAGIVYATDALVSSRVRVAFEFDPGLTEPIVYPLMLLEAARENVDAVAFFDFLNSAEATETFERHGFTILVDATDD